MTFDEKLARTEAQLDSNDQILARIRRMQSSRPLSNGLQLRDQALNDFIAVESRVWAKIDEKRLALALHVLCGEAVTEWPHRVDFDRAKRIIEAYEALA